MSETAGVLSDTTGRPRRLPSILSARIVQLGTRTPLTATAVIARRLRGPFSALRKRSAQLWPFGYKRILLLEDDMSMQRLVRKLLRSLHARVELFGKGRDVIARITTDGERYDAFLLDLMMPHDGGLSVLRNLRDHHPGLLGRVILLTASGAGITDPWRPLIFAVVHKPFEAASLVSTVRACTEQP